VCIASLQAFTHRFGVREFSLHLLCLRIDAAVAVLGNVGAAVAVLLLPCLLLFMMICCVSHRDSLTVLSLFGWCSIGPTSQPGSEMAWLFGLRLHTCCDCYHL
jgi:hypothetical protein